MKHLAILAALALTACALPGTSGVGSFMTAMHPTQDFCASRGLTLDATTKQCVTPPQPPPADVTGSVTPSQNAKAQQPSPPPLVVPVQPPAAPVPPPPPQDRQRAVLSVPIEPDAVIYPKFQDADLTTELAHFVRASGYRCDSISALHPGPESRGFKLVCNRSAFRYAIENQDGRWNVTVE